MTTGRAVLPPPPTRVGVRGGGNVGARALVDRGQSLGACALEHFFPSGFRGQGYGQGGVDETNCQRCLAQVRVNANKQSLVVSRLVKLSRRPIVYGQLRVPMDISQGASPHLDRSTDHHDNATSTTDSHTDHRPATANALPGQGQRC